MSELPLAGKVAWITGSSRGLGRVMAEELCEMGACVAVHGGHGKIALKHLVKARPCLSWLRTLLLSMKANV